MNKLKIVVLGGTGLIGSKLVPRLLARGHEVISASPSKGVNAVTGQGLDAAFANADVVVDVTNSPDWEEKAVLDFFVNSEKNIAAAEKKANVKHHVALSVVGTSKMADSGYFRAKMAQEKLIREAGVPYTIVQATQFFDFLGALAEMGKGGDTVSSSTAYFQPIAADDVAESLREVSESKPLNGVQEIAGPEKVRLTDMLVRFLADIKDPRKVVGDANTSYASGTVIQEDTLLPTTPNAKIYKTDYATWFPTSKFAQGGK